jgi:hypothetical protein
VNLSILASPNIARPHEPARGCKSKQAKGRHSAKTMKLLHLGELNGIEAQCWLPALRAASETWTDFGGEVLH